MRCAPAGPPARTSPTAARSPRPRPALSGRSPFPTAARPAPSPGTASPTLGSGASARSRVRVRLVAVAHAGLGDQPARPGRVRLELAPQLSHVQPQVAGGVGVAGPPHLGQQLVPAEQLAGVA